MSPRIVIDPITRIEGHLRIEAELDATNKVTEAYSSGTMVRGIEIILKGRDPRDAWAFAQRACGVCTTVHSFASIRSVEDALGIKIPKAANLMRNMMIAQQYVHDHVMHFYILHALDWVDVVSALKADPQEDVRDPAGDLGLAELIARLLRRRPEEGRRRSSTAASSPSSPTPTGATRPTSCRRRSTCWPSPTTWKRWTGSRTSPRSTPSSAARTRTPTSSSAACPCRST